MGIVEYWREQRKKKKYLIPPEMFFIIKYFQECKGMKISVEVISNENEVKYLEMILMNVSIISKYWKN